MTMKSNLEILEIALTAVDQQTRIFKQNVGMTLQIAFIGGVVMLFGGVPSYWLALAWLSAITLLTAGILAFSKHCVRFYADRVAKDMDATCGSQRTNPINYV
jgi:hypothetical protein